ncbi:MAG: hypothetical protein P4L96_21055 [Rhodoferax sp.]|nr:hypothetical protein [Rhodoferax sp.]
MDEDLCSSYDSLIIFFAPGFDMVSGGVMSIISLAAETKKIFIKSKTGVFVCVIPHHPPLSKFTKFENDQILVNYRDLLLRCSNAKKILLHVPEIYTHYIAKNLRKLFGQFNVELCFNILLQNIDVAPSPVFVNRLKLYGAVTITTAHKAYSGEDTRRRYNCPVHHLSVWISPDKYIYQRFDEKKELIVISPDTHEFRGAILKKIQNELPQFEFVVIKDMTYSEYLQIISAARFSLTFGEGLDGYFAESVFSGGIGIAVYNDRFFDEDYKKLNFVYPSWDELVRNFTTDVLRINRNPDEYEAIHRAQFEILASNYSYRNYQENIISFYERYFSKKEIDRLLEC